MTLDGLYLFSSLRFAFLAMALLALPACADVRGPQWLTGEPGDEVLNAPRAVSAPSGASREGWPNLADVPKDKPVYTPQEAREQSVSELMSDNMKAQADLARIQSLDPYDGIDPALRPPTKTTEE